MDIIIPKLIYQIHHNSTVKRVCKIVALSWITTLEEGEKGKIKKSIDMPT